ncbi:MAG: hypothetical protein AB7T86_07460 [Xanthobacteraceae bacterium]|uniref:hypothetical protein n=1 Tax=Pseudolabrys sp. TaxID=1960880 RepID=UPI003D0DF3D9
MSDLLVAKPAALADRAWRIEGKRLAWIPATLGIMLALMGAALWNGFPLIFPDTGGYFTRPIEGTLDMGRSALYGLFLYIGIPFAFWPAVLVQCALTAWLIVLTLRAHGLGDRPGLAFGIVLALCATTGLPWFAGQLMPDIFFPLAVLALHLLVFRHEALNRAERTGLVAVIAFAMASHMAALGVCAGALMALALLRRIWPRALPPLRAGLAAVAVASGIALALLSNAAITGNLAFTPGGANFLFGRLIEDGIVARYVEDECPDPALRLCAYRHELPGNADDWLWGPGTAFYKLGGDEGFRDEAREIIADTLTLYPAEHLLTAIEGTLKQLVTFKTEVAPPAHNAPAIAAFKEHTPQWFGALMAARQQSNPPDAALLNLIHWPVAATSLLGLVALLAFRRRLGVTPQATALIATVLLALAANAAVCGIFSHPVDRYQSRMIMLAPFAVAVVWWSRRRTVPPDRTLPID